MDSLTKKSAIVGVAESDCGAVPDKTALELMAQATKRALDDAGLVKDDIDGLFCVGTSPMGTLEVGEYLKLCPRYTDSTNIGGTSFMAHVEHATAAIAAGFCHTALICHARTPHSDMMRGLLSSPLGDPRLPTSQFERIYGTTLIGEFAIAAHRHMHQYGTTSEQLAEIAVATRKWAAMNPNALMRDPITIDDVLNSPMISTPLHRLDCCVITDAGGAVILTSAERARDLKNVPVWVLGCGEYHTHFMMASMPDLTCTPAKQSGEIAFNMAGLTPKDIDVAELYDAFTIMVLLELEDLGFCPKGEGGPFVSGQTTAPGGTFPLNTNGGGLSFTHPGMYGIFPLIEAARQLRGTCGERQVPGARIALCSGIGVMFAASSTVILGRE